jgi:hypothetical protein
VPVPLAMGTDLTNRVYFPSFLELPLAEEFDLHCAGAGGAAAIGGCFHGCHACGRCFTLVAAHRPSPSTLRGADMLLLIAMNRLAACRLQRDHIWWADAQPHVVLLRPN